MQIELTNGQRAILRLLILKERYAMDSPTTRAQWLDQLDAIDEQLGGEADAISYNARPARNRSVQESAGP